MSKNEKTKRQIRWYREKQSEGWKFVSWVLPPEVKLPLHQIKKYLMAGYKASKHL